MYKKNFLIGLLFICTFHLFGNIVPPSTATNYFISGEYEEQGVSIYYSAVINALYTQKKNGEKQLSLQLSSFNIEDAKYNNVVYRDNDIFGISFPVNTAVEITAEIKLLYGEQLINETIVLHPNKKTQLNIKTNSPNLPKTRLNAQKTIGIKALHDRETFIGDIKNAIKRNNQSKDPEAIEAEHTRLMVLGNNYLNENNYKQAISTYQHAKKYTTDISYAESQITTTSKYAEKNDVVLNTQNETHKTVSKDYYTKKQPSILNKKESSKSVATTKTIKTSANKPTKSSDGSEYEYESNTNKVKSGIDEPVYAVNYEDSAADEFEYEYESATPSKAATIFDQKSSEFEYEYDGPQTASTSSYTETEVEYETESGEIITEVIKIENKPQPRVNKIKNTQQASNYPPSGNKTAIKSENTGIKKITSTQKTPEVNTNIKQPANENYEIIRTKKGYIKYRKDEQAIVDREGNILIPYGKYEIIRFRAGFARIKVKDDVAIKNVVCANENEEYNWSARIYENPWKETVIDESGEYVDKVVKKVEIYIVDNVSNKPNSELSPELLKKYEDPNPFKGTKQISAFNLWNRKNANDPAIIQKRAEIERLKQVAKDEAYLGAKNCKTTVTKDFEEVFNYYQSLGYEIILKN